MKRGILKNRKIYRLAKTLAISAVAAAGIGLFIYLLSWADRGDKQEFLRQKECWKEIYAIIEKSPKEKAEWIKETIANRRSFRGDVNYCGALEFIDNGQER